MRDAARRGAAENVDRARDPDADDRLADDDQLVDAEEAGVEIVERNPDPDTVREAFEREIAERGESEEGAEIGTLVEPRPEPDRVRPDVPPADQR
jgi:hypothetical protein